MADILKNPVWIVTHKNSQLLKVYEVVIMQCQQIFWSEFFFLKAAAYLCHWLRIFENIIMISDLELETP